ncbi:unnamed protein product [Chironomus riparius]|uniref:Zinc finger protein n=1 Tax=Chironomus riparius TaxID=315576 RepID=A0A9N9WY28_9DIPT|nr:unnamed protein product [Chironomus riparius]
MDDLCRICRKDCYNNSTSIKSKHEGVPISEMLTKTCPIDITFDDPISQLLPKSICNDCLEVISAAFNLQRVCVESDQYFRSMISNDQIVVKDEFEIKEEELPIPDDIEVISDGEYHEQETEHVTYLVPVNKKRKIAATTFNPRLVQITGRRSDSHYECNFCLIQTKPRQAMLKHMKQEHDPAFLPHGCDFCAARFKSEDKKYLHENVRHINEFPEAIICEVCGVNGISEEGMKNHMKDDHKIFKPSKRKRDEDEEDGKTTNFNPRPLNKGARYDDMFYSCNFCDIKQKPRKNLLRHMYTKHDPITHPFYCSFCILRFKEESKKSSHENTHDPSEPKIFICEVCTATGDREIGMLQHKMDDHGMNVRIPVTFESFESEEPSKDKKKSERHFHPRPLPGSESLEYEDIWYTCNFCDKKIKPKKSMLRHMRKHSAAAYPFGCEYCIERFEDKDEFEAHYKYVHENEIDTLIYFCDLCGASGDHKEGMENHMTDDHLMMEQQFKITKKREIKCSICYAKFLHKRGLDNHLLSKHKETTKCDKCDAEFSDKREMNHHIMMIHSKLYRQVEPHEVEVSYKCCKCEQDHQSETDLDQHLEGHRNSFKTEKTKCHFCPKNLKDFIEFLEHAKYHAQPQTHECLTCKKRLPFDDKLLNHVKNHKRYDCYKVECKKCTQKFRSAKDLEIHDKVKHNKETLFICPICAKSLSSANGLDQHIRYVHNKEQEKKFQCKFCPMKFILKTKLTRHEAVHSTERPHVCEICGSSFKHNEGLSLHMKRHNGTLERKHECSQCSHKFTTKHRLDQHMMTHTGLKPHECKFCDRAYASKGDLVKHMQKLHVGDAIYQCDKCPKAFRVIVELREHQHEHGGNQYLG